jgi:HJR/Mrr/RecB family endonuclease
MRAIKGLTSKERARRRLLAIIAPYPRRIGGEDEMGRRRMRAEQDLDEGRLDHVPIEIVAPQDQEALGSEYYFDHTMRRLVELGSFKAEKGFIAENSDDFHLNYDPYYEGRGRGLKRTVTIREALAIFEQYEENLLNGSKIEVTFGSSLSVPSFAEIIAVQESLVTLIRKRPEQLHSITPRQFEVLIRECLEKVGFDVELTAQTRDGGCDLIAVNSDPLGLKTIYAIEAKHFKTRKVGVGVVRQLNTVRQKLGAHHGIVITSSFFSRDAVTENSRYYGLHLKDYDDLMVWLRLPAKKNK